MGALEYFAASLLILANQNAKSAFIAIFCYVVVFLAFIVDFFVFGRVIQGWDLASALMILSVTVGVAFVNCRQEI